MFNRILGLWTDIYVQAVQTQIKSSPKKQLSEVCTVQLNCTVELISTRNLDLLFFFNFEFFFFSILIFEIDMIML